jgi:hypothetical protein
VTSIATCAVARITLLNILAHCTALVIGQYRIPIAQFILLWLIFDETLNSSPSAPYMKLSNPYTFCGRRLPEVQQCDNDTLSSSTLSLCNSTATLKGPIPPRPAFPALASLG